MAKALRCRDVGIDCDFVARAETEEEILKKVAEHAATAHNMKEIPEEVLAKVVQPFATNNAVGNI